MKSLFIKEYLELRAYLVIIILSAILLLTTFSYLQSLDGQIVLLVLFVGMGPLMIGLTASHMINSEVKNNTFPFLINLPVSRGRLWLSKLLTVIFLTIILYGSFLLISFLFGTDPALIVKSYGDSQALALGLPLLALSLGFFCTMLPQGFGTIAAILTGIVIYVIGHNELTRSTINVHMISVLVTVMFLVCSYVLFVKHSQMNSLKHGLKGIAIMTAGFVVVLAIWSALYAFSSVYPTPADDPYHKTHWRPLNNGKSFLLSFVNKSQWYDVFKPGVEMVHTFKYDLESGKSRPFAERGSWVTDINNAFLAGSISRHRFGFYRQQLYTVFDNNGKALLSTEYDYTFSKKMEGIDKNRFAFVETIKNKNEEIQQFVVYETGKGKRVAHASQSDFYFENFIVMPSADPNEPARAFIAGVAEGVKGLTLISMENARRTVLPIESFTRYEGATSDYILLDEGRWNKDTKRRDRNFLKVELNGNVQKIGGLDQYSDIVGVTSAGSIIATKKAPVDVKMDKFTDYCAVEINLKTGEEKLLMEFPDTAYPFFIFNEKSDLALLRIKHDKKAQKNVEMFVFNFSTGSKTDCISYFNSVFPDGFRISNIWYSHQNICYIEINESIYAFDLGNFSLNKVVDLQNLMKNLKNGGV